MIRVIALSVVVVACLSWSPKLAFAQFFASCTSASESELDANIAAHEEHMYRLGEKFLNGYYHQGELPRDFRPADRQTGVQYLSSLQPIRTPGLLFYAYGDDSLCVWLLSPGKPVVSQVQALDVSLETLASELRAALGVAGVESNRTPIRRGVQVVEADGHSGRPLERVLDDIKELLIPSRVEDALLEDSVNTLVIVPVSAIGTIPFAALPLGDAALVDRMSVTLAPGFFAFRRHPQPWQRDLRRAVLAGAPDGWEDPDWVFPPLPGARGELLDVAEALGIEAHVGVAASRGAVEAAIAAQPRVQLVYLATHGIGDFANPLDASFLLMSDGRWPAAQIQNLKLEGAPLVVLSACQTGLGKNFDVGIIGMARAWHRAGAAEVVMSLWSVGDQSTRYLMRDFLRFAGAEPADMALRQAMLAARQRDEHPRSWAGFAVFGLPSASP